jgi:PhzF family phenazine biosynthesis protein
VPSQRFSQVDAFTQHPFAGNPAAVCLLPVARDAGWMQRVAREMNLAETAFLVRRPDGFDLRWFTPTLEVDLCGHATLASAHTLWEDGQLSPSAEARFHTRSGVLTATRHDQLIWLDFPATPSRPEAAPPEIERGLGAGVKPVYVGRTIFDYLLELESESAVRALTPDLEALKRLGTRGVIVTARSNDAAYDFVSRFFAPRSGIAEDPVTGSAHCGLGPYWSGRFHKQELVGYQASERGGVVRVRLEGDRALLGGHAVTVLRGELLF